MPHHQFAAKVSPSLAENTFSPRYVNDMGADEKKDKRKHRLLRFVTPLVMNMLT